LEIGILKGVGQFRSNFHVEGDIPHQHLALLDTNLSLTVFTQMNFVADFFKWSALFDGKRLYCVFQPPFGCSGAT